MVCMGKASHQTSVLVRKVRRPAAFSSIFLAPPSTSETPVELRSSVCPKKSLAPFKESDAYTRQRLLGARCRPVLRQVPIGPTTILIGDPQTNSRATVSASQRVFG